MIEIPHGEYAWLLLAFLPGVWLAARWLLGGLDRLSRRILTPVLAYVIFIITAHIAALLTHSLFSGVSIASTLLGISGYALFLLSASPEIPDDGQRLPASLWIIIVLTTIAMTAPIIGYNFYDELSVPGHQSTASEMLNGYYPPVYLAQPSMELRYHYGFDLLTAAVRMMLHIRIDQAIDLNSLLLWIVLLPAIWLTSERLFTPGSGMLAALIVPFGAGLTFLGAATRHPRLSGYTVNVESPVRMMLPLVTNFFQRPWAVGLPAMCLALILIAHCVKSSRRDRRVLIALFAVVLALPIIEAAVFLTLLAAAGLCLLARFFQKREHRVLEVGIVMILASLAATQTHGFFIHDPRAGHGLAAIPFTISLRTGGIGRAIGPSILWNLYSFGLRLPLGIAGLWLCLRKEKILAVMALGSFFALNVFKYNYTADIIKFATLFSIPLSFGTAVVLLRWWSRGPALKTFVAILTLGIIAQSLIFLGDFWIGNPSPPPIIRPYLSLKYPISSDEAAAISWLSKTVRPPENLYRWPANDTDTAIANEYCSWGGLPIVWPQSWDPALGMADETINHRRDLRDLAVRLQNNSIRTETQIDDFVNRLRAQGVVWMVVDKPDDWLVPCLQNLATQGHAEDAKRFGDLRVFRLK